MRNIIRKDKYNISRKYKQKKDSSFLFIKEKGPFCFISILFLFLLSNNINLVWHRCNMPFYNVQSHNGRLLRLPYNINTSRNSNPLEDYIRQMSENTAIQRELIRARLLAPLIEQDRIARQQNTPYNQVKLICY